MRKKIASNLLWEGDLLHVVFQPTAADALEKSFELDDYLNGEIFVIKEDYAVAPIKQLATPEGWQERKNFWESTLNEATPALECMTSDKLQVHAIQKALSEQDNIRLWIWVAQNAQDVCGYYWLLDQLAPFQGKVCVLYLNNLPFINEKGQLFYPTHLEQIQPREFVKAKRLAREITTAEFELDSEEWRKMMADGAKIRTLDGGKKILSQPDNFYDTHILQLLGKETFKVARLLNTIQSKIKERKTEYFWLWRIKQMITNDVLLFKGDKEQLKEGTIKANTGELFEEVGDDDICSN